MPVAKEAAEAARDRYLSTLSQLPGMDRVEVAKVDDGYALSVRFRSGVPADLPRDLDGVPVVSESADRPS
ncbi:hypothetical protein [Azospirillum rugosum]|uniref:Uncharacterized protein n=1 Tax=Azospirillum rugosum TaxID=416170 RepID=A0ABS4SFS5_9PROT|nr:hypothetical protein [Azospirillum rugosum]MBP2291411.1 hypothetical protein [Azospirillum rugosum]MDQ0525199.1 hypothetical protein [Azospirillum rugosum]